MQSTKIIKGKIRIAYLWGADFSNIFHNSEILTKTTYVLMPCDEPNFNQEAQRHIKEKFGNNAISVSYDQEQLANQLIRLNVDIIISMGWRRIFQIAWFNALGKRLLINIHPAILPYYKGYHTEPYVIINEEPEHGITAHYLTPNVDDGEIIYQKRFPISKFSTTASIKMQAYSSMPQFLKELISRIQDGLITGIPQDESLNKVVAPKRKPEDSEIDPQLTLLSLYNNIRACNAEQYPAFFYIDGQKVFITIRRAADAQREHPLEI